MMNNRYYITIASVQTWKYVYEIDANDEAQANELALEAHRKGQESIDNWVDGEEFYQSDDVELINT
jgi:hypothetical protein